VRCLKTVNDRPVWMDAYLVPQSYTIELTGYRLEDKLLAKKLQKLKQDLRCEWEVDIFFAPVPIKEQGRPYYPNI